MTVYKKGKPQPTEKQQQAKKRNFVKMRIAGCVAALKELSKSNLLCEVDRSACGTASSFLHTNIIRKWDKDFLRNK